MPTALQKILLVDDEHAVRTVVGVMLRRAGYDVISAGSGEEALELYHAHAPDIHVVVSDIAMPGMQGPELAQRLIALRPDLYVLLISGYIKCSLSTFRLDDRNVALLSKPFTAGQLTEKLQQLLARSSPVVAPRTAEQRRVATRTVLVVDDDATTVELYARLLRPEGFAVCTATTADEGLRVLAQASADAVLVDLRMPDMDGVEFLRRLRRAVPRRIPAALVTGDYFVDDSIIAQAHALGADMHFKPLWFDDLVAIIKGLMTGVSNRATQ